MHARITARSADQIKQELHVTGVTVTQNPDVLFLTYGELSVDDAREIATYAHLRSLGEAKYLVITFDRAGEQAQNALLKVVEEAPGSSRFYFSTPNPGAIIPTLRSRCVVEHVFETRVSNTSEADAFLAATYAERLSFVEKMVTQAQRTQDRTLLREFARALVHVQPCRETLDAARYLEQNGSSPKLVLSHLAVVLPTTN